MTYRDKEGLKRAGAELRDLLVGLWLLLQIIAVFLGWGFLVYCGIAALFSGR